MLPEAHGCRKALGLDLAILALLDHVSRKLLGMFLQMLLELSHIEYIVVSEAHVLGPDELRR